MKMIVQYLYLYGALLISWPAISKAADPRFILNVHNVSCSTSSVLIKLFECDVTKVAPGRYITNFRIMVDRTVSKEADIQLKLKVRPYKSNISKTIIDLRMNLCAALNGAFGNSLLNVLMHELRRTSNMPFSCPVKANFIYKVQNFTLTNSLVPAYAPYLNATFIMNFLRGSQIMGSYVSYSSLEPKD